MTYETLAYSVDQGVLTLSLNRPAQLNAFTVEMANELTAAFERASEDDAVGAIVVTGNGRAFCAGADMRWYRSLETGMASKRRRNQYSSPS